MIYAPWMDPEIQWIVALQAALSPALDWIMIALSWTGEEKIYIALIPFVYWCLDRAMGRRMLALIACSSYLNGLAKWLLHSPRPYWYSGDVTPKYLENSFCPPSGHSQNALAFWLYTASGLAHSLRRRWPWLVLGVFAALVSFSRVYLAMHFPHSVLLGWLIGALILLAFLKYAQRFESWYFQRNLGLQAALAIGLAAVLLLLMQGLHLMFANFPLRAEWLQNAARSPGFLELSPFHRKDYFGYAGILSGLLLGSALCERQAKFRTDGAWLARLLRYALGVASVVLILYGPGALFHRLPETLDFALRYLRYFTAVLWAIWLWPRIFLRLGLAHAEGTRPS
ncbi:MAG: phosphatase PAP2 family protein [Leptospirales bacterium]|nr:phosphatase PAP2 family protein [Leptospirales bacterium]